MNYQIIAHLGENSYIIANLAYYADACYLAQHLWLIGYTKVEVCAIKTGLVCASYEDRE